MRILFFSAIIIASMVSCTRDKVEQPSFDITTASLSYKVGDTIRFDITGNPDNLTFFSGEAGRQYINRERRSERGKTELSFTSYGQYLNSDNEFRLLVSTDFTGATDSASIRRATWQDVTSRATLSTGADNTPSGNIDLSDFGADGSLLTFAFMYKDKPKATSSERQATWTIKNLTLNNVLNDGTVVPLVNLAMNIWGKYSFENSSAVWANTTTQVSIAGGTYTSPENEDWLVSKTIEPAFVKPDVGVILKNAATDVSSYSYRYTQPGTYTAVFEASNVNYKDDKRAIKQFVFTITP